MYIVFVSNTNYSLESQPRNKLEKRNFELTDETSKVSRVDMFKKASVLQGSKGYRKNGRCYVDCSLLSR